MKLRFVAVGYGRLGVKTTTTRKVRGVELYLLLILKRLAIFKLWSLKVVRTLRWNSRLKTVACSVCPCCCDSIKLRSIPHKIAHQFSGAPIGVTEMLRCAKQLKLRARAVTENWAGLMKLPLPAIVELKDKTFIIVGKANADRTADMNVCI